jgi:hypothetical protein
MDEDLLSLESFNERERELFARSMNTLFSGGFILSRIEKDKPLYRFVLSHLQVFEAYLGFSGWSLSRDESLGVIALKGPALARFSLNLEETVGLLVLRVLYEEKRLEVTLARETAVRQSELQSRYKVLSGRLLNKTRFVNMLRRFRSRKLIALAGEETDPEALIILYPSIAFVLDGESIDDIYGRLEKLGEQEASESASEEDEIAENPEPPIEDGGA